VEVKEQDDTWRRVAPVACSRATSHALAGPHLLTSVQAHFKELLHTMSRKAIYQIKDKPKQHQSFLTSFARGTATHEALMSTSIPLSGCKLGLIPGVIMPLHITEKNTN
jgi:hypothetical protein